jgi:hypothetical protein
VICSLCGQRKARRACPALGRQICAVCCGTKRLTEIDCPADCAYLAVAREHPPSTVVRRQQREAGLLVQLLRDFNERQLQIFVTVCTYFTTYPAPELQPLIDEDVAEACGALAATFETAARGVIYEHRPESLSAERLAGGLKKLLADAASSGGAPFERDAAGVLRHIQQAVAELRASNAPDRRAFLEMVRRLIRKPEERAEADGPQGSRLIVP